MNKYNNILMAIPMVTLNFIMSNAHAQDVNTSGDLLDKIQTIVNSGVTEITLTGEVELDGNIGQMSGEKITIDGTSQKYSINGNGHKGIIINNEQSLELTRLSAAGYSNSETNTDQRFADNNGTLTLKNGITISNNGNNSTEGGAIRNSGVLNMAGVDINGEVPETDSGKILTQVRLSSNKGINGAALYNEQSGTVDVLNGYLATNTATGNGGAVYNKGSLNLQKTKFSSNIAKQNGGALYNTAQKKITINDGSNFTQNIADGNGGAIYNETGTKVEISDTLFYENAVKGNGGTIYNKGDLSVKDTTFTNSGRYNSKQYHTQNGGAIYNEGTANIDSTSFKYSAVKGNGGAIFNEGDFSITNTDFIDNGANSYGGYNTQKGGAIYNTANASIDIEQSNFTKNTAQNGGAIYNEGTINLYGNSETGGGDIDEGNTEDPFGGSARYNLPRNGASVNTFSENTAITGSGGAIYNKGIVNINSGIFTTNTAKTNGGAIYNEGTLSAENTMFTSNGSYKKDSTVINAKNGGAIYNKGNATIIAGAFDLNKAITNGGAIMNDTDATMEANQSYFTGNSASNGGAIYNKGTLNLFNNGEVDDPFGDDDTTGGDIDEGNTEDPFNSKARSSLLLNDATANTYTANTAKQNGGAVYNEGTVNIVSGTFASNEAKANGGAVYSNGSFTIDNAQFNANNATDGGAVYSSGSGGTIQDSEFNQNFASGSGGAVYNNGDLKLNNVNFAENGIVVDETNGNRYSNNGGAIRNDNIANVEGGVFSGNYAAENGGAIYNSYNLSVKDTKFENNGQFKDGDKGNIYTQKGGAIYNSATLKISGNTSFDNNAFGETSGRIFGGAIYNKDNVTVGESVTFNLNGNDEAEGGAIYNTRTLKVEGSEGKGTVLFNSNIAQQGGAIKTGDTSNVDADSSINHASFFSNYAVTHGGAIFAENGTLSLNNSTFSNNSAYQGGALYNLRNTTTIENSVFSGNESFASSDDAILGGGAVKNENGDITIVNSKFSKNTAAGNGGAIFNSGSLSIANTDFTDNIAESGNGGAIYTTDDLKLIANGNTMNFAGNIANEKSNAIFIADQKKLELNIDENGIIKFDDGINGTNGYTIAINGAGKGRIDNSGVIFNNKVENAGQITVKDSNLTITENGNIDGSSLRLDGSLLNLNNSSADQILDLTEFSAENNSSIIFDADLSTGKSDSIKANAANGSLTLDAINILNDGDNDITVFGNTWVDFANLDDFIAGTSSYTYRFTAQDGKLIIDDKITAGGLNAVVKRNEKTRSYSVGKYHNVFEDLGTLEGQDAKLTILGNDRVLNGEGFDGLTTQNGQTVVLKDIKSVEGFNSTDGGFIKNSGTLEVNNTSFKNNTATDNGGAIWSDNDVNVTAAQGTDIEFTGNTARGESNAVYMAASDAALSFRATGNSSITLNDKINGVEGYKVNFVSDQDSSIKLNNFVENAGEVMVASNLYSAADQYLNNSSLTLQSGKLHLNNNIISNDIVFKNLKGGSGELHLDVDTYNSKADFITVENLSGTVNVVAHNVAAPQTKAAEKDNPISFAKVINSGGGAFKIFRVIDSVFDWTAKSETQSDNSTDWTMEVIKQDDNKPVVVAETAAYMGLNGAAFEQTRNLVRNVVEKTSATTTLYDRCNGLYDWAYDKKPLHNLWVSPVYSYADLKAPVDMDADIYGLEAGADILTDIHNRYGVFASYRQGNYELNGKTDRYNSTTGSEIDIDSYLAGMYYRYTNRSLWAAAVAYGGIQKADIKSDDGVRTDTDATEFGLGVNAGYAYSLNKTWVVEPTLGANYTQISYDNISDNYGKKVKFDDASQIELEAGLKFEKLIENDNGYSKVYIKPSIIQTIVDGERIQMNGLNNLDTMKNMTLGKAEVGFSASVNDKLTAFGAAYYVYGKDYDAASINLGLNYAF